MCGRRRSRGAAALSRALACYTFGVVLAFVTATSAASEVTLRHQGLVLNAGLDLAAGKQLTDGVILITHGGLAHRDMEMITALRGLLNQKGYSTLAINLSLGLNDRHGMYDCKITHRHRNTDAADEIGVWLEWLKQRGVTRVTLLGHSRGGAQTAYYAVEHHNPLVRNVVLIAPAIAENTSAAEYERRFGAPLAPVLARAQQVINSKHGPVLRPVGLMNCANTSATASSFMSYYGQSPGLDTPSLLPKLREPTLVLVAGSDEVVVGLDAKVAPLADGKRIQMKVIEGSNHTFQDIYAEEAIDAVDAFLKANK